MLSVFAVCLNLARLVVTMRQRETPFFASSRPCTADFHAAATVWKRDQMGPYVGNWDLVENASNIEAGFHSLQVWEMLDQQECMARPHLRLSSILYSQPREGDMQHFEGTYSFPSPLEDFACMKAKLLI